MIFLGRLLSNNSFEIKVVQEDYRTFKFVSIRSILIIVRNILNYPLSFLKVLVLLRFKRCFLPKYNIYTLNYLHILCSTKNSYMMQLYNTTASNKLGDVYI